MPHFTVTARYPLSKPVISDIKDRRDIEQLMNAFYSLATADDLIGHHFVGLDMDSHIPVIVDFWDKLLFGRPVYFGNPLMVHRRLDDKSKLKPDHFLRWVEIFEETVDRLFEGDLAEAAKSKAGTVAKNMSFQLNG